MWFDNERTFAERYPNIGQVRAECTGGITLLTPAPNGLDVFVTRGPTVLPADWDPDAHKSRDGEWHLNVRLPHEIAEFDGHVVPLFEEVDPERAAYEQERAKRGHR